MLHFAFVTINYYSSEMTENLVRCINAQRSEAAISVLVYDNSGDYRAVGTEKVIRTGNNAGIGPVWSTVLKSGLDVDCVIFLNNDVTIPSNFVHNIYSALPEDADCFSVPIRLPNGDIWSSGGRFSKLFKWRIRHSSSWSGKLTLTDHLSGCFYGIMNKKGLFAIGSQYLETYFFRGEEWQLNKNYTHQKKYLLPVEGLTHEENGSHERFSQAHIYYAIRAKINFCRHNFRIFSVQTFSYILYLFTRGCFFYTLRATESPYQTFATIFKAVHHGLLLRRVMEEDIKS